uniref:Uncharacterized protein n=1 Tax=Parascaris equorum TaxID=6256 RepID=A0A914RBE5_PAREQ
MRNFAVAITIYVRHLQIVVFYGKIHHVAGRWRLYSTIMMCIGYVIAFGVSLVANVQVSNTAKRRQLENTFIMICIFFSYAYSNRYYR